MSIPSHFVRMDATTQQLERDPIVTELSRALSRYEALCSPPRHLLYPTVGDMAALDRAIIRALDRDDERTARELFEMRDAEILRRLRLRDWQRGVCDRSPIAWDAISSRLSCAIHDALEAGVLKGEPLVGCRDRQRDAAHRRDAARRRAPQILCRYSDCTEQHAVAGDHQRVTCGSCRDSLGLPQDS